MSKTKYIPFSDYNLKNGALLGGISALAGGMTVINENPSILERSSLEDLVSAVVITTLGLAIASGFAGYINQKIAQPMLRKYKDLD